MDLRRFLITGNFLPIEKTCDSQHYQEQAAANQQDLQCSIFRQGKRPLDIFYICTAGILVQEGFHCNLYLFCYKLGEFCIVIPVNECDSHFRDSVGSGQIGFQEISCCVDDTDIISGSGHAGRVVFDIYEGEISKACRVCWEFHCHIFRNGCFKHHFKLFRDGDFFFTCSLIQCQLSLDIALGKSLFVSPCLLNRIRVAGKKHQGRRNTDYCRYNSKNYLKISFH